MEALSRRVDRLKQRWRESLTLTEPYQYKTLDETAQEIRLLTLHPGDRNSPIHISLDITPFTQDFTPTFEALSYAWGSPLNPTRVLVHDSGFKTLSITRNLGEALPYLRYADKPRVLWIDAICVNQADLGERSQQVKRMADIFSQALRVIAWLGLETDSTRVAVDCFLEIGSHVDLDLTSYSIRGKTSTGRAWASDNYIWPFRETQFAAISNFLGYSWFERLWIRQEIRLAQPGALVMCGSLQITWVDICKAVCCLQISPSLHYPFADLYNKRLLLVGSICFYKRHERFDSLLQHARPSKCTDQRDRIFALLSLRSDSNRGISIQPDYSRSIEELYTESTVKLILRYGDLEVLTNTEIGQSKMRLPSWVPDWSVISDQDRLWGPTSTAKARATVEFLPGQILRVYGKTIGTVERSEPFKFTSLAKSSIALELKRVILVLGLKNLHNFQARSLCRILCSNIVSDIFAGPSAFVPDPILAEKSLSDIIDSNDHHYPSDCYHTFLHVAYGYMRDRSLFTVKSGKFGLAPQACHPGDLVTALLGCNSLMILRPRGNDQYLVVGEANCDGFMDAEAFLGPLPESIKYYRRLDEEKGGYWWVFRSLGTGAMQVEDPRLGPLPTGWQRKPHPEDAFWAWFVNEDTGEELTEGHNPRLTLEGLTAHGVEFQTFDLA